MVTGIPGTKKLLYQFSKGDASMTALLGGKGSNLCEMVRLGLPVPPGFVISTETCLDYFKQDNHLPDGLAQDMRSNVGQVEAAMDRKFGSVERPLLVAVRSGARVSMPGMMDTILNLGINDSIVKGLASEMGDPRPALDAYRRFLQIYADVVMEVESGVFEEILSHHKEQSGITEDHQLTPETLNQVITEFKNAIRQATGTDIPVDPWDQLMSATEAVFRSWNNPRAIFYRNHNGIDHNMGTAVTIMAMVFGNLGPTSGTGVLFTRNPSTGERKVYGEFLSNAQGEDVVAGVRTPQPISALAEVMPEASSQLMDLAAQLESHYHDAQDIEFTIENGRLFILQTRNAKRTPPAAVKIAVDLVREGSITKEQAILQVNPEDVGQLMVPQFKADVDSDQIRNAIIARGSGASPGAATGKVFFDATRAAEAAEKGEAIILVRPETKPDDIHGIAAAVGVVTSRGGATSHAAVVTRGMGKPCIVGCEALQVDLERRLLIANDQTIEEGSEISIDGTSGNVYIGQLETVRPTLDKLSEANELLDWADQTRRLGVWANADTPVDADQAVALGAEGIGLCRTEHMFLDPLRLPSVRLMLLNAEAAERWRQANPDAAADPLNAKGMPGDVQEFFHALDQVRRLQTDDFTQILKVMAGRPVIIRLLDAPLHEFLPQHEALLAELTELRTNGATNADLREKEEFLQLVESLREANPMLGHRGCRLGLSYPAIYEMQVEAIITASGSLIKDGLEVQPEIMVPLTSHVEEMRRLRQTLTAVADQVQKRMGVSVPYKFGTMIETPRGAIVAGEIAEESDFFSFGTNDLTQMTFGFSRDDAEGKFLRYYVQEGILPADPFTTMDPEGVGALVAMAVKSGRNTKAEMEMGICGEHGGDPASIEFCHEVGLNYVSCSPYRVPVARLAAAQAALKQPS
jgi:pyruvate,orthophosphate dikinase